MGIMDYLNEEQQSWVRYLNSLPPEKKCECGWNRRGECDKCPPEKGGKVQVKGFSDVDFVDYDFSAMPIKQAQASGEEE